MIFCIVGCVNREVEIDGVTYELHNLDGEKFYYIGHISSTGDNSPLYIPDEINGIPVTGLGHSAFMMGYYIKISGVEKVYFPWSISYSPQGNITYVKENFSVKYVISPSTTTLIDDHSLRIFVVAKPLFDQYEATSGVKNNIIPANVAYMFNYQDEPNEGYFFVDLLETSGIIIEPPYLPKRDGYVFEGWYRDENCTKKWNFKTDTLTIDFDENGNRIYEEFRLYAKWIKQ